MFVPRYAGTGVLALNMDQGQWAWIASRLAGMGMGGLPQPRGQARGEDRTGAALAARLAGLIFDEGERERVHASVLNAPGQARTARSTPVQGRVGRAIAP